MMNRNGSDIPGRPVSSVFEPTVSKWHKFSISIPFWHICVLTICITLVILNKYSILE
jgi:hypothetical protein